MNPGRDAPDDASQTVHSAGRATILIVDDHEPFRDQLARSLVRRGHTVRTAANFDEAVAALAVEAPHRAIVDLRMPGKSGLELLAHFRTNSPATQVVMLTGFGSIVTAVDAMRLGATNFLPKPADADEILAAFESSPKFADDDRSAAASAPSLAQAEWDHIHRVLADCGGNISEAARRLGIHRRSLQRKLKKLAPDS